MGEVTVLSLINSDAERMDAFPLRFDQGLASVFDPIVSVVPIVVIRFAVAQSDQQTGSGLHTAQKFCQMPDGRSQPRILQGPEVRNTTLDRVSVRLIKAFDPEKLAPRV